MLFKEKGIAPDEILLPPPDRDLSEIAEDETRFISTWARWTDSQLKARVGRFYDYFQDAYRWLVESYFPTLRDQLYFYRVGPVKFDAVVYKDTTEVAGSQVSFQFSPVATTSDRTTRVTVSTERRCINPDYWTERQCFSMVLRSLDRSLGPFSRGPLWSNDIGYHGDGLWKCTGEGMILHDKVFDQLLRDFSRILGKLPGALTQSVT